MPPLNLQPLAASARNSPRVTSSAWKSPDKTTGEAKSLVDLIALVRHALHPQEPVAPLQEEIGQRYREWLDEQAARGVEFTPEQREWLDMIKDHIATSMTIAQDDFQDTPFAERGGLGRVYQLFGDSLVPNLLGWERSLGSSASRGEDSGSRASRTGFPSWSLGTSIVWSLGTSTKKNAAAARRTGDRESAVR